MAGAFHCDSEFGGGKGLFHQAMAVAVKVQHAFAPQGKAAFSAAFGIKLDQLQMVSSQAGEKRKIVLLRHRVRHRYEQLIFNFFEGQTMGVVGCFGSAEIKLWK